MLKGKLYTIYLVGLAPPSQELGIFEMRKFSTGEWGAMTRNHQGLRNAEVATPS